MNMITRTSAPAGSTSGLTARVAALPRADKTLLKVLFSAALLVLVLGLAGGFVTALARAGALIFFPDDACRLLSLHGVSVFFYWLYLIQAALLLVLAAAENGRGLALRPLAWLGAALMLSAGLVASAISGIATVLQPRLRGEADEFTSIGFALFAWAGFLVVSAIAATNAFLPSVLWSIGAGPFPADHGTEWHILFHNLHYLPLMALVGIGATVFAIAISVTVYGVVRTLLSRRAPIANKVPMVDWRAGAGGALVFLALAGVLVAARRRVSRT